MNPKTPLEVQLPPLSGHVFAARDAQNTHPFVIRESRQQLGRNEEILACVLVAGDFDHATMHHTLISRIHTLVDFVNDAEGGLRHGLEGHEEENS